MPEQSTIQKIIETESLALDIGLRYCLRKQLPHHVSYTALDTVFKEFMRRTEGFGIGDQCYPSITIPEIAIAIEDTLVSSREDLTLFEAFCATQMASWLLTKGNESFSDLEDTYVVLSDASTS